MLDLPKNIRRKILKEEGGSMDISRNLDAMEKLGIEKSILSGMVPRFDRAGKPRVLYAGKRMLCELDFRTFLFGSFCPIARIPKP